MDKSECTSSEYIHDLSDVATLLEARKDNVKRLLQRTFTNNKDFVCLSRVKQSGKSGGRPTEVIKITKECRHQLLVMYALSARRNLMSQDVIELNYITRYMPKETEILDFVQAALLGVYNCSRNMRVDQYSVDMYIHNERVVVECDEYGHTDRSKEYEEMRQLHIEEKLGCVFFRFDPDSPDFGLAKTLSSLLQLLKGRESDTNTRETL